MLGPKFRGSWGSSGGSGSSSFVNGAERTAATSPGAGSARRPEKAASGVWEANTVLFHYVKLGATRSEWKRSAFLQDIRKVAESVRWLKECAPERELERISRHSQGQSCSHSSCSVRAPIDMSIVNESVT